MDPFDSLHHRHYMAGRDMDAELHQLNSCRYKLRFYFLGRNFSEFLYTFNVFLKRAYSIVVTRIHGMD